MKVLFSGGATLGPVTPLLAIADTIREDRPDTVCVWIGTTQGPERPLIEAEHIRFYPILSGKLRRYFSFSTLIDIGRIIIGCVQSLIILYHERPDICVTAGGFVSVPVHWAAHLFGIPTWVHQQDVRAGLANKLMAKKADVVTTALEESRRLFPGKKTMWIGNPVRKTVLQGEKATAQHLFGVGSLPVVFATGGGTGSQRVNQLVAEMLPHIHMSAEVIHLTGKERSSEAAERAARHFSTYHTYTFFTEEMKHAYAIASVVISRAGFGTLTELAALKKPVILVPKEGHQEDNARYLAERGAAIIMNERTASGYELAMTIRTLLEHPEKTAQLGKKLEEVLPIATSNDIWRVINLLTQR